MTTTRKNNSAFYVGFVIAAAAILIAASVTGSSFLIPQKVTASTDTIEEEERVSVGGGNITISVNQFSPAAVEIQTGESVTFYAPQNSTEVHNVIFDLSNKSTISDILLPFTLPSGISAEQAESLQLAPPFKLGEPITQNMSDGTQTIIGANKVAFYPAVVDHENNTRYLIDQEELQQQTEQAMQQGLFEPPSLSANYTMNGTEAVVSSGIILDVSGFEALEEERGGERAEVSAANMTAGTTNDTNTNATVVTEEGGGGEVPPPLQYPILNDFTVTFDEPGTYEYFCAFHPGMYGIVTVAGEEGEAAGERAEVSAANMTAGTTNDTNTNATVVTTTPIPPAETGQENATATAASNINPSTAAGIITKALE
jgi:plastocyanin